MSWKVSVGVVPASSHPTDGLDVDERPDVAVFAILTDTAHNLKPIPINYKSFPFEQNKLTICPGPQPRFRVVHLLLIANTNKRRQHYCTSSQPGCNCFPGSEDL